MPIIKNPLIIVQTGGGENKLPDVLNKTVTTLTAGDLIGVTQIPDYAFQNCIDLTSVEFSSTLQTIGSYAFSGCSSLTSIDFGENSQLTSIGDFAFYNCDGLTEVDLSNCTNLTSIGGWAFSNCTGLTSITLPSSLTSIGDWAFQYCGGLGTLEYKGTIDQWLSIDFGSTWMTDSSHTFIVNGEELTNLVVPEGVTSIGDSAFYGCSGLTSITLPSSLTSIGDRAFRYCSGITSITLPSSLTSIGNSAFRTCVMLTTMTILATTPPTLSSTNAISTATTKIYIPAGTLSAYQSATNWSNFADKFEELPA